ncbi:Ig-like domain-containing protein [Tissierella sp. MB52-C2]|uniref:Ig-like domain-containing protein n=1 Tax=Tissierella sp. MB52-C2 TaxID=3070999 RepID=UPI00280ADBE1|nr:Ig-like domain-containing protein [Tissierella sp. MB52-C2]WMM25817.1 Ig-like domain-containing protein [Tissierella sp. MB52-C2]
MKENIRKILTLFLTGILLLGSIPAYANFTEGNIFTNKEELEPRGITTLNNEEFQLKIKVTIANGPKSQVYVNNELYSSIVTMTVKNGDKIKLKAVQGENERFVQWTAQYKKGMNTVKPNTSFGSQKDLETTFTVTDDLKNASKNELTIFGAFTAVKPVSVRVEPSDVAGLSAESEQNGVIVGGDVVLSSECENEDYQFSFWELDKAAIHPEFINKDVNINDPNMKFLIDSIIGRYNEFNIIAHFEEKSNPKVKIKNMTTKDVEIYYAEEYQLPKTVEVEMTDGKREVLDVAWIMDIVNINNLGTQTFYGVILGYGGNPYVVLNLKVKERDKTNFQMHLDVNSIDKYTDPTLKIGVVSGEDLKGSITLEKGKNEIAEIKAIDGEKTRFKEWKASGTRNYENEEFNYLLEDPFSNITTFKIDDKLFGLDKNRVGITAKFDFLNDIKVATNYPDIPKLKVNSSHERAVKGDKVKFTAISDKENYKFSKWEMNPIIVGVGTPNPNVDLNNSEIEFEMIQTEGLELEVTAYFEEKKDLTIKRIDGIKAETYVGEEYKLPEEVKAIMSDDSEEFVKVIRWNPDKADTSKKGTRLFFGNVEGYSSIVSLTLTVKEKEQATIISIQNIEAQIESGTEYVLPKTVTVKMSDNSSKEIPVTWTPDTVDLTKIGESQIFTGTVVGYDGEVKLTLTIKEKEPVEEILEIKTVELLKDGQLITEGRISGKEITITLPKSMSQEEIDSIALGGYFLKIIATDGVTIEQENGYVGPFWQEGKAINTIYADAPTKFILHGENSTEEYILTIKASAEEKAKYTVNFNTNGGNSISSQEVEEGNRAIRPSSTTKNGYRFIDWYKNSNLIQVFDFNTPITENITLYAKWEEVTNPELKEFIVTFDSMGGSSVSSQNVIEGRTAIQPKDPIRSGYKFINWYTESNLNNIFNFNTSIIKDIELFAKWEKAEDPKEPTNELPRIIRFSLLGYEASIDDRNERITINLPYNMNLSNLVPSITITDGASISPSKDSAVNFNRTVYYTVYGSGNTQKTYRVIINIPSERDSYYWDDYYDNYKKERDDYYKRRGEISWWELAKEAKEKRAEEELKIKSERDEKLVLKERAKILNDVGKIESRARNSRSSLMINDRFNHIEIRPTVSDFKSGFSNIITIPKDVLPNLLKGEYEFIKYHTGVVNIEIYPSMETASGLKLNLRDIPKDIQEKWNKVKGKGYIFQVESDSTKGGLSYEINLEKQYPVEKLRFVKYNYMKGNFEDVSPEKWYVFNGKLRCDKVSAGIYGIIYKD